MLPKGFTRVERLRSSGGVYIDTGVQANSETRVRTQISVANQSSYPRAVFGERNSTQVENLFSFWLWGDSQYRTDYGASANNTIINKSISGTYSVDKNKNVTTVNGSTVTVTKTAWSTPYTIYLFSNNYNNAPDDRWFVGDMFDVEIYSNDVLVRDYVSAIDSSGHAGYFDEISREMNIGMGGGAFSGISPIVPGEIAKISRIASSAGNAFTWEQSENANEYVIYRDGVRIDAVYGDITSYTDTNADLTKPHTYTVTPYNGTQAGVGAVLEVESTIPLPPKNLTANASGNSVILKWDAVSGVNEYIIYRDDSEISRVSDASYSDNLGTPFSVDYEVAACVGNFRSELSGAVRAESWGAIAPDIVSDRTANDVERAKALIAKYMRGESLSELEQAEWDVGLRGCYNTNDVNRVEYHTRELQGILNKNGYNIDIDTRLWAKSDIMRYNDIVRYLGNIETILNSFGRSASAPPLPTIDEWIDYTAANNIEKILYFTRELILGALAMFRRAGTFAAGNNYEAQVIRRA